MIINSLQLCADRVIPEKAVHPEPPCCTIISGTITGDSSMKDYKHIRINGKQKHLHRCLMEAYIGRELKPGEIVHHKDGDKHNNILSNLEITTRSIHIRTHKFIFVDKERLVKFFINERLPLWKVAEKMDISRSVLFRALKRYNIICKPQPCKICSARSKSRTADLCRRCYNRLYHRKYKRFI